MEMQFKAGYIVDCIAKVISDFKNSLIKQSPTGPDKFNQVRELFQHISSFEVEFPYEHKPDFKNLNPVLATLNNIITRGLPTRAPLLLENLFAGIELTEPGADELEFTFTKSKTTIDYETVFKLLRDIEPLSEINPSISDGNSGSSLKRDFIENHRNEYLLVFIPLAVARIQKTLLEILLAGPDLFKKEKLKVAIIERDVPAGAIAVKSFQELVVNINALLEEPDKLRLPEMELSIFETHQWATDKRLHLNATIQNEDFFRQNQFDIIIDHAILRQSNIYKENYFHNDKITKIRSAYRFDTSSENKRRIYCSDLLHYKTLVKKTDDGSYEQIKKYENNILFFVQNIFRKIRFCEGQLPLLSRALQQKPAIGLLPAGGGKSLAYQLSAFLQPGLCLVIDPTKFLMEDQVRILRENRIDCCSFIHADLNWEDTEKQLADFGSGRSMFLFILPEKLATPDFRNTVQEITTSTSGFAFSYCVIDEAHCFSEWGHDFRASYLMLGKNASKLIKTKEGKPATLIGLTATASFEVLADIEKELQIKHDDASLAIITTGNTIRPELFFRVIDTTGENRMNQLNRDFLNMGHNLQKLNDFNLLRKSLNDHKKIFDPESDSYPENLLIRDDKNDVHQLNALISDEFSSIVFCPVNGKDGNNIGVDFVYKNLDSNSKGYFCPDGTEEKTDEVREHFDQFFSGKINHLVCTKSFGIGIDKEDIRSTYHLVYPGSPESLIQETGRAGMDRKISEANILVSKNSYFKVDVHLLFNNNKTRVLFLNKFTRKSIRQTFEKKWNEASGQFEDISFVSGQDVLDQIDRIDFSLMGKDGRSYNVLPEKDILELRAKLKETHENGDYKYISEKYEDREIHDYFHKKTFKSMDAEKSQLWNLFYIKEFQKASDEVTNNADQDTLANTFNNCRDKTFGFSIPFVKKYPEPNDETCNILHLDPEAKSSSSNKSNRQLIQDAYDYSADFNDFLFLLEEKNLIVLSNTHERDKADLFHVYKRDRETNDDTRKLMYRMHHIGLLEDYTIGYKTGKLYNCSFNKFNSIDDYIKPIELYLQKYVSENTTIKIISELRSRLIKPTLVDNIVECLYFLTEFSYKEIERKRKRTTDIIGDMLNTSITDTTYASDWYRQNLFIKEQIYFYFNAKYAKKGFRISGQPYSLLDDYFTFRMDKYEMLDKYLNVFNLEGTEQGNYKHMVSSCRKLMQSLGEADSSKEWVLHLLKAFAMYSMNNTSGLSEANAALEQGFDNLYQDKAFHRNNFRLIEIIFKKYFQKLQENIQTTSTSFRDIKIIRLKLLLKIQTLGINNLIDKNNKTIKEYYA